MAALRAPIKLWSITQPSTADPKVVLGEGREINLVTLLDDHEWPARAGLAIGQPWRGSRSTDASSSERNWAGITCNRSFWSFEKYLRKSIPPKALFGGPTPYRKATRPIPTDPSGNRYRTRARVLYQLFCLSHPTPFQPLNPSPTLYPDLDPKFTPDPRPQGYSQPPTLHPHPRHPSISSSHEYLRKNLWDNRYNAHEWIYSTSLLHQKWETKGFFGSGIFSGRMAFW